MLATCAVLGIHVFDHARMTLFHEPFVVAA